MKDLFEHYEEQSEELKELLKKWSDRLDFGLSYKDCNRFKSQCQKIGYTFDYYLTADPYGLRPIGTPLNELEGYEEM